MRFLSLKGAKKDLLESGYSDRQAFKYCLAFVIWMAIVLGAFGYPPFTFGVDWSIHAVQVFAFGLPILGTWLVLYRAYQDDSQIPFFAPYFTLGWVANVRATLVASPIYALYSYMINVRPAYTATAWFLWILATCTYNLVFYTVLYRQIKALSSRGAR